MTSPRLARRLFAWCASPNDRVPLLAELDAEYKHLAASSGAGTARRWYRGQLRRSALPLLRERVRKQLTASLGPKGFDVELREAARSLVRHTSTSALVVTTLGVASAAVLAAVVVLDAVVLAPLPYPAADRIVRVWNMGPALPAGVKAVSFQDLDDWRRSTTSLDSLSAYTGVSATLTERGDPRRVEGMRVAVDFDRVFGLHAAAGRLFSPDDYAPGAEAVIVVTHQFWQTEFPRKLYVDNQHLMLDGRPRRIVGVLPPEATTFPAAPFDFWMPLVPRAGVRWESSRATGWIDAVGRLRDGVSLTDAAHELSAIVAGLAATYPDSNGQRQSMAVLSLQEDLVGRARPALVLVAAATVALLVVAFGNVLHLLVAHGMTRRQEYSVRHALGAGQNRLARQAALEAVMLSAVAVTLGLLLSPLMLQALAWLPDSAVPRRSEIHLLPGALFWATLLFVVTAVATGWPLVRSATRSAVLGLTASTRITGSRADRRTRYTLVAAQVGLSVVLILGGVLFIQTLHRLESTELGFSPGGILTLQATPSRTAAPNGARTVAFYRDVMDRVRALPGVSHVAASTHVPFVAYGWAFNVAAHDGPPTARHIVRVAVASQEYFETLGARIVDGRALTEEEQQQGQDVTVISERLARLLFGNQRAVGQTLDYSDRQWRIAGVVADTRARVDAAADATMYLPWHNAGLRPQVLLVKTSGVSGQLDAIRRQIREIDTLATISEAGLLKDRVARTLAPQRFRAGLLAGLAALAALLAVLGAYSVTTFAVATQRREQAIRLALGERVSEAQRRVVLASVRPAAAGVVIGMGVAWYIGRFIDAFLFESSTTDERLLAVPAVVLIVVTLAALLPSLRLARVDPASVFREER